MFSNLIIFPKSRKMGYNDLMFNFYCPKIMDAKSTFLFDFLAGAAVVEVVSDPPPNSLEKKPGPLTVVVVAVVVVVALVVVVGSSTVGPVVGAHFDSV